MCGINGYALPEGPIDLRLVEDMNRDLHHRGPDEGGVASAGFAGLGMRRLAIVDLTGGQQPLHTADGRYTLVYNGELYDHRERRRELEAHGARFRTSSDTEVVAEAWADAGRDALRTFNGMFAFAIADRTERSLVLVRDQLGIKPLYYWLAPDGELVFSSELKSLLAHPRVPRQLDRSSLAMLLVDRCVHDPWTLFDGIRQLPPGHLLRWQGGEVVVERYWELTLAPEPLAEADALAELQALLDESVRSQLVADVPVGVFLSGGIDSGTVAAYAARASEGPLHSFNVASGDPRSDESGVAREVARHIGSTHHELSMASTVFEPALLDHFVEHVGQPLADLSCLPTWLLSRFAREEVKVVLSGDGGDELFGGYDHMFWAARVRRSSERTPALVRRLGAAVLAGVAPIARGGIAEKTRRARRGLELTFQQPLEQLRSLLSLWSEDEARALCGGLEDRALRPAFCGDPTRLEGLSPEEYAMSVLAQTYLPGAILTKVDRMSMSASLEVRVPLLDQRIVEFAARLPLAHKVRGRTGKHLLREAGRDLLPANLYAQPKRGFGLELSGWLGDDFWDLLHDLYAPGSRASGLFDRCAVAEVIRTAREAPARPGVLSPQNACTRAWLLALIGRWSERYEVAA